MRWTTGWPRLRSRPRCVVGLDIGTQACEVLVLRGSANRPESVCCAEQLNLPEAWVVDGEVRQAAAFGQWLRSYLASQQCVPNAAYLGLDSDWVTNHRITLAEGLLPEDESFQLQAEAQSLLPDGAAEVCIDFVKEASPTATEPPRFQVQAAPRHQVQALQHLAQAAGLHAMGVEPRHEAVQRAQASDVINVLPPTSRALAAQCHAAFGLALRAWSEEGTNFLPYREQARRRAQRAWVLTMSCYATGGAFAAAGFALAMADAAQSQHPPVSDLAASARAYDEAKQAHTDALAKETLRQEQVRWLASRQALQSQSLQWSRVLSSAAQGVWVESVTQQAARWTVQGEALSPRHAQQLLQQLKALDIWAQAPELPLLQAAPERSKVGVTVWHFRIEAGLKVGL